MSDNQQPEQPKNIIFDNKSYQIEDLTPRAAQGFNMLVRLQQEINELDYQTSVKKAAQSQISVEVRTVLKEDKIKGVEIETEKVESDIEEGDTSEE